MNVLVRGHPRFSEEDPDQLANALGIAVDTHVFAHDVLDGLDGSGQTILNGL